MKHWLIIILFALLAQRSEASDPPAKPGLLGLDRAALYLYDQSRHLNHAVKSPAGPLHPHRIYMKYDEDLHTWVYVLSGLNGRLANPIEALRPETVASGGVVGAKLALQRFILTYDGSWLPTTKPEIYRIWRKSDPPVLRDLTFTRRKPTTARPKAKTPPREKQPGPK
jgi:hypothetical protein